MDFYLNNDHMISVTDYAYRSYLETLLSFNDDVKGTWLQSAIWQKDKHRHHDTHISTNETVYPWNFIDEN